MDKQMTPKEKLDYRIKLFRDAQAWKKPDRTPICGNIIHWMYHNAGYTTAYAARHYEAAEDSMVKLVQQYKLDHINISAGGWRQCDAVTDLLGGSGYVSAEKGDLINFVTEDMTTPEEYDAFVENTPKAYWELMLARRYPQIRNMSPRDFAKSVAEFYKYSTERERIHRRIREEFGVIVDMHLPSGYSNLEIPFNGSRGIKGLSMDLRRNYDKVKRYCEVLDEDVVKWVLADIRPGDGWDMTEAYDAYISSLTHVILRPSQFEDLVWPCLDKILTYCAEHGKQVINFMEGPWAHVGKFYNQFPRGTVCMMVESDDPFEIRKKFPNVSIYGGLDTTVLAMGSKQQCIDMAKKAIDELGWEGGLILAPNKMVAYPDDIKGENLEAVCDFVQDYR